MRRSRLPGVGRGDWYMSQKLTPTILSLCDSLPEGLESYFSSRQVKLSKTDSEGCTHILCQNLDDFNSLSAQYKTIERKIKVISLSEVEDRRSFFGAGGELVLNADWFQSELGEFILDKFFQGYAGVELGDSYPSFVELGHFHITNPFSTGDYLDRMVYEAFKSGYPAFQLKTFFDHMMSFLTILKASEKVGFPLEFGYGAFGEVFGLQVSFFSQDFSKEDFLKALGEEKSEAGEALRIAMDSCGFFDFTLLQEVSKVVVTSLWTRTGKTRGNLLLNSLEKSSSIGQFPQNAAPTIVSAQKEIEELPIRISGSGEVEAEEVQTIKGLKEEKEASTVVKGGPEEKETSSLVKGSKAEAEKATVIKGSKEEKAGDMTVKSLGTHSAEIQKLEKQLAAKEAMLAKTMENFNAMVAEKDKEIDDIKNSKNLSELISRAVAEKERQFDEELNRSRKENELLKGKMVTLGNELKTQKEAHSRFNTLGQEAKRLAAEAAGDGDDKELRKLELELQQKETLFKQEIEKLTRQNLNKESMLTRLKETSQAAIAKKEAAVQDLQTRVNELTLSKSNPKLNAVMDRAEMEFKDVGSKEKPDLQTENELNRAIRENEFLKGKITTLSQEMMVLRDQLTKSSPAFKSEAEIQNLQDKSILREAEKDIASKDFMLEKNRESFNRSIEKKDELIKELQERNNQLLQKNTENTGQAGEIVQLERQVQNLTRLNDAAKAKIISLLAEIESLKNVGSADDPKRLQMIVNQNKVMIETLKRDLAKAQERGSADNGTILALKNEKSKLELELKKVALNNKVDKVQANLDQEAKKLGVQNQMLEAQLKESQNKVKDLEGKLVEILKAQKNAPAAEDPQMKTKLTQLETSVKKLGQDLLSERNQVADAKKEINKARLEKTALQNQLDKLKKELEKAKAAAPKKGKAA